MGIHNALMHKDTTTKHINKNAPLSMKSKIVLFNKINNKLSKIQWKKFNKIAKCTIQIQSIGINSSYLGITSRKQIFFDFGNIHNPRSQWKTKLQIYIVWNDKGEEIIITNWQRKMFWISQADLYLSKQAPVSTFFCKDWK